jgi:hypothetical protein
MDVEELSAVLVADRAEPRSEPLEGRAQTGHARPILGVGRRRGAEGSEIAEHQGLDLGRGFGGGAEPCLHRRERGPPAPPPEAARGHLHGRQRVHRVAEGVGVAFGHRVAISLTSSARLRGPSSSHTRIAESSSSMSTLSTALRSGLES